MWFCDDVHDKLLIKNIMFNFLASWWYKNYGIEFDERSISDADYRVETDRKVRLFLFERFGHIHLGDPNPQPRVLQPQFQNTITAALVGCRIEFQKDAYPWAHHLPDDKLKNLYVPEDLWSAYPYSEIRKQVIYLNNKLGCSVKPFIPPRGILNDAIVIRGTDFLYDIYEDPQKAKEILDFSFELMKKQILTNFSDGSGGKWMIFNCTAIMVGPKIYEEFIFPYDLQIADLCKKLNVDFQIHHCGKFDDFAHIYRRIENVEFIDIGHESDISMAMELFPDIDIQYIIESSMVQNGSKKEIRNKIISILEASRGNWQRLRFNVCDIDYGTPDENVEEIYNCCKNTDLYNTEQNIRIRPYFL